MPGITQTTLHMCEAEHGVGSSLRGSWAPAGLTLSHLGKVPSGGRGLLYVSLHSETMPRSWLNSKTAQAHQVFWPVYPQGEVCFLDSFCGLNSHTQVPSLECRSRPGSGCSTVAFPGGPDMLESPFLEIMPEHKETPWEHVRPPLNLQLWSGHESKGRVQYCVDLPPLFYRLWPSIQASFPGICAIADSLRAEETRRLSSSPSVLHRSLPT